MSPAGTIAVTLAVAAGPRQVVEVVLPLRAGTCVAEALRQALSLPAFAGLAIEHMPAGIWGRKAAPSQVLHDGDRLELYRPLQVDPKVARRERFAQQGARSTGLFAKRRPGAKPGY